jgi:hypothetical protein
VENHKPLLTIKQSQEAKALYREHWMKLKHTTRKKKKLMDTIEIDERRK